MANFYTGNPHIQYHLQHPLMERIARLRERGYADADQYDYASSDYVDALDSYQRVLEIVGEVCGKVITPNAAEVGLTGPTLHEGRVSYDPLTAQDLDAIRRTGLMGMALPRRYGGLNMPITPYTMVADMVSHADAGFKSLWELQDCAETLYEFGSEGQCERFLPRVCAGETMSMDLTEPDTGSDLQAVMLKAIYNETDQQWYLNGVKRFITNGDSDIHLVLARNEEGTKDTRGLSMLIYDAKKGGVTVRHIEYKMGIKGIPTCELVFENAPTGLRDERRPGPIRYVTSLMNGARLGIMVQAVGISEATYREAKAYAADRHQYGCAIGKFPAAYEMLALIRVKADATRAHLYKTGRFVGMYKAYDNIAHERKLTPKERKEQKYYGRLADAYTSIGKDMSTELADQNVYDCIQIYGGSGYIKDYTCERLYRDTRITSIYEGTTQLQVVAAIRHVTTGAYFMRLEKYQQVAVSPKRQEARELPATWVERAKACTELVTEAKDQTLLDYHAHRPVEMYGHYILAHLLLIATQERSDFYEHSMHVYVQYASGEMDKCEGLIRRFDPKQFQHYTVQTSTPAGA